MIRRRAWTLIPVLLAALMLASTANASPYSVSVMGAGGRVVGARGWTGRFGMHVDVLRATDSSVGLGLECGWLEEAGSRNFSYATEALGGGLQEEHQRELSIAGIARLAGKVMYSRPYLLVGAGGYKLIRRDRYPTDRFVYTREYAPGLTAGVGISGSAWPAPTLEARWHRVFANSDPNHSAPNTTDILLLSAGVRFN